MAKKYEIRHEATTYGFNYGSAEVERLHSDDRTGGVVIMVTTPKGSAQVYVTRTGKIRLWLGRDECKPEGSWRVAKKLRGLDFAC